MRRWVAGLFVGVWHAVGLRWLPARGRLPARLALLFLLAALVLWRLVPFQPRTVLHLPKPLYWVAVAASPDLGVIAAMGHSTANPDGYLWKPGTSTQPVLHLPSPYGEASASMRDLWVAGRWVGILSTHMDTEMDARGTCLVLDADAGRVVLRSEVPLHKEAGDAKDEHGPVDWHHVYSSRLSPDGRTLALLGSMSSERGHNIEGVVLWDVRAGRAIARLPGAVEPLAFSPDGRALTTAFVGEPFWRRWDAATGQALSAARLAVPTDSEEAEAERPLCLMVQDDSVTLGGRYTKTGESAGRGVTQFGERPVFEYGELTTAERVYDPRTGRLVRERPGQTFLVRADRYLLTAEHLLVLEENDLVRVRDRFTGEEVLRFRAGRSSVYVDGIGPFGRLVLRDCSGGDIDDFTLRALGPGRSLVVAREVRESRGPWRSGWAWLDERLERWWRDRTGQPDDLVWTEVFTAEDPTPVRLNGWLFRSFVGDGRSFVAISEDQRRLAVWDLALRPPWPLILGCAAVPPGLVLLGIGVRRAWRGKKVAPVVP